MKMNLQPSKFTIGAPLGAIAVSAMLLMGSVTGASAGHGYQHQGSGLGAVLGGAALGAIIGGAAKGKKGAAVGAGVGAAVGLAATANRRRAAPPPHQPAYAAPAPGPVYATPSQAYPGNLVYDIQNSLARLQYNPGPIDGIYGRRTADAIGQYEFNSELPVTGQPSEALRYRLQQQAGG